MSRTGRVFLIAVVAGSVMGIVPPAHALTVISTCGVTVTDDAQVTTDLVCAGDGIVIGASNLTVDLNGHTITGTSFSHYGVRNRRGFDNVTIINGTLQTFEYGISFFGFRGQRTLLANGTYINNVHADGNDVGISIYGDRVVVASSTASNNIDTGIGISGRAPILRDSTADNGTGPGVSVVGPGALVSNVNANHDSEFGIYVQGPSAIVLSSVADFDGTAPLCVLVCESGIVVYGDGARLEGNDATNNGYAGRADGVGLGILVRHYRHRPTGHNFAALNDDSRNCVPAPICA